MSRPIVLLDCDGVLADFIGGVCSLLAEVGHTGHRPEHVTEFDFCKALKLPPDVARAVKVGISHSLDWWTNLKPLDGAREGVAALREVADIYVVTSPWNSARVWLYERESWLKRHFDIRSSHLIACSAKHLVSGDVFVDDRTDAVAAWAAARPGRTAVQWRTLHNRGDVWDGLSTNSWTELLAMVQCPSSQPPCGRCSRCAAEAARDNAARDQPPAFVGTVDALTAHLSCTTSAWHLFHALWTKAVGQPDYEKSQWKDLERLISGALVGGGRR